MVHNQCQEERLRKGHKYLGNYPCERIKKKSDTKGTTTTATRNAKGKVDVNQANKSARKQGGRHQGKQPLDSSKKRHLLSSLVANIYATGNEDERNEREEKEEWVGKTAGEEAEEVDEVEEGEEESFVEDGRTLVMGDPAPPPSLRMMMTGLWSVEPT